MLEHVDDADRALSEMRALLVKGGSMILQYPPRVKRLHQWDHDGGHVGAGYSREELVAKVEKAGFRIDRVDRAAGLFGAAGYLIDVVLTLYLRVPFVVKLPLVPLILGLVHLDVALTRRRRFGGYVIQARNARPEGEDRPHG